MAVATLKPMAPKVTQYGMAPELLKKRAVDLPGMTSVLISELFPEITDVIYTGADLPLIREQTKNALKGVDFSMIKPGDSVNILGSHHGFTISGGGPYAEMLRTIRDEVAARTGARDIRLRVGVGLRWCEGDEYIKHFELDTYYGGKAEGVAPVDKGFKIDTEIGALYGLKKAYDAKWIIQAHNSNLRELHAHRMVDRIVKAFGMSYARIETRSTYHRNLGPRGANLVARAIFESPFVQEKFVASVILKVSPSGINGVDADNNLLKQSDRITVETLGRYGKLIMLLNKIEECITVLDCPNPIPYTFASGLIFGNFLCANIDLFDLTVSFPPLGTCTEGYKDRHGTFRVFDLPSFNPALKAVINNYSFKGYMNDYFAEKIPTIVVGQGMADLFESCDLSPEYMSYSLVAKNLDSAMAFARQLTGTENVIAFDGAIGGLNVSESLKDILLKKTAPVRKEVEDVLMPKWLKQRGISIPAPSYS